MAGNLVPTGGRRRVYHDLSDQCLMSRTAAAIRVQGMGSDMEHKQGIDSRVRTGEDAGR